MKRLLILFPLLMVACVPVRRFDSLRAELISAQSRLDQSRQQTDEYADANDDLQRRNVQLKDENAALSDKLTNLKDRYDQLLDGSKASTADLTRQMANNASLNEQLANNASRAATLEQQVKDNAARVAELERLLKAREDAITNIKNKVTDALTGFDGKGLSITQRDGQVYVSMDDKLLFRSGSFEIGREGTSAIGDLAAVLARNPDVNIMVAGHTDDVPFKGTGQLIDNLDLSAKRATSVVRLLLKSGDIDPSRVIAAGRGEWLPVTMGTSAEARSRNRRTEIILSPKLDELRQLLK